MDGCDAEPNLYLANIQESKDPGRWRGFQISAAELWWIHGAVCGAEVVEGHFLCVFLSVSPSFWGNKESHFKNNVNYFQNNKNRRKIVRLIKGKYYKTQKNTRTEAKTYIICLFPILKKTIYQNKKEFDV